MFYKDLAGTLRLHIAFKVAAADATAVCAAISVPYDCTISTIQLMPAIAVTGDNTNYQSISVARGSDSLGSYDFKTGHNATALTAIALTPAVTSLSKGDVIAVTNTKGGTGVALGAMTLELDVIGRP